jgi:uncharacterized membrane protein HdeD (DUF308 family)
MLKRIDESARLSKIIDALSNRLARQRGLPLIIGIVLVFVALIVQSVNAYANSDFLELIGVVLQNAGIITALIGIAMVNPLGK